MNFITATMAVSLFPRTTFVDRVSYTCGRDVTRMYAHWFACSADPPIVLSDGREEELPSTVCSQRRQVADRSSWIVRFLEHGVLRDGSRGGGSVDQDYIEGVKFDILDWTARNVNHHFCISIMEPFMLE